MESLQEKKFKGRYRNKLDKIVAEVFNGEKWIYIKTLSDPIKDFPEECLAKVSQNSGQNVKKGNETFAQSSLTESSNSEKKDTNQGLLGVVDQLNNLMDDVMGVKKWVY